MTKVILIAVILKFLWCFIILVGTAYVTFWLGYSGWWWLLAILLMAGSADDTAPSPSAKTSKLPS